MKICIWCTKIFDLGGTKRVVTLLANELVKEHDVTIMVYQDRFKEDRNMYHMSEDIKVDFIDNNEFVNRHHTPAFCWRYLVQKLNAKYGIFHTEKYNDILADAIFPKKTREKWVKYLNEQNYDIIITTASLSLRLGMLAPELNAKTIGCSITVMPDILMFLMSYSGNRNVCSTNICRSWTDTLFSVTMISAITKNFWILIQKLKLIPEAS